MNERDQYKNRVELLQGTLDTLILQTLQWGPQHGYGIVQALFEWIRRMRGPYSIASCNGNRPPERLQGATRRQREPWLGHPRVGMMCQRTAKDTECQAITRTSDNRYSV
jgi:hypothetical protein